MRIYSIFCLLILGIFTGCTSSSGGEDIDEGSSGLSLEQLVLDLTGNVGGFVDVPVTLATGQGAFQVLVGTSVQNGRVRLISVREPSGAVRMVAPEDGFTEAHATQISPATLNYPVAGGPLGAGAYTVQFQVTNNGGKGIAGAPLQAVILKKRDGDFGSGTVKVNIARIGPVGDSENTLDAIEEAMDIMKEIFDRINLKLDFELYDYDGPDLIPGPKSNSNIYLEVAARSRPNAVNILLAIDMNGLGQIDSEFTLITTIPGPGVPTAKSGFAISILEITGRDGRFDLSDEEPGGEALHNDEERLLAEEMAQGVAHYLGLQHIVELSNDRATGSDVLADTPSCITAIDCSRENEARSNLMFPAPLREPEHGRQYYPRDIITPTQALIIHANTLVD